MDIGPIDPEEIKVITFPFAADLTVETLVTAVVTSNVLSGGADPNYAQMVVGAAVISGTDVKQRIKGMVNGVTYQLRVKATDSAGNVHVVKARLTVKE